MAVKIRLKRVGRRHLPKYRINAMDSRSPRDGRAIEELGFFDPHESDPEKQSKVNVDRVQYWLSVGAKPSERVRSILKQHGVAV